MCILFYSLCYTNQLLFLEYTLDFSEQKCQEVGVKKICISNTEDCTDGFGWLCSTGTQRLPKLPHSVLLATLWACLANCSKVFKPWRGQKAIFIHLTSPSFLDFTVSLGFPPRASGGPGLRQAGSCLSVMAKQRVCRPHGCLGLLRTVTLLQRWAASFWRALWWQSLWANVGSWSR